MRRKVSIVELARMAAAEIEAAKPLKRETEIAVDEADLCLWLLERCAFRDLWWGGTSALQADNARWRGERGYVVPFSRPAFEEALKQQGIDVEDGLAYGLVLKREVDVYERLLGMAVGN